LKLVGLLVCLLGGDHVILGFLGLFSLFDLKEVFFVILLIFSNIFVGFLNLNLLSFLLSSDLGFLSGSDDEELLLFSSSFGFFSLSSDSLSSLFFLLQSSSSLDSQESESSLISSDDLLLSVVCLVSFDLLNVNEFDVIAEALFLVASVWVATHFSTATSVVATVVVLLVSVVLRHHFSNVLDFTVTFVETVEDNTIATLAPLAFFSASVWLCSWCSFAVTLLPHVRGDIFAPESVVALDPRVWCSLSSDSKVRNGQERIGLWLWCLVDRVLVSTESSDPSIANTSELSIVVSNVSWALGEILLDFVVLALWISLHLVSPSVPMVSSGGPISSVPLY